MNSRSFPRKRHTFHGGIRTNLAHRIDSVEAPMDYELHSDSDRPLSFHELYGNTLAVPASEALKGNAGSFIRNSLVTRMDSKKRDDLCLSSPFNTSDCEFEERNDIPSTVSSNEIMDVEFQNSDDKSVESVPSNVKEEENRIDKSQIASTTFLDQKTETDYGHRMKFLNWRNIGIYVPYIVYQWIYLIYHSIIIGGLLYFLAKVTWALYADYRYKFQHFQREILLENEICARNYVDNKCAPDTRVPAMVSQCLQWEKCMHRDPDSIASTKISASVLAEILESFVENLSYKSMAFVLLMVSVAVCVKWLLNGLNHSMQPSRTGSDSSKNTYNGHYLDYHSPLRHKNFIRPSDIVEHDFDSPRKLSYSSDSRFRD